MILLAAAAIIATVLLATVLDGSGGDGSATPTPSVTTAPQGIVAPVSVVRTFAYDPNGDGTENDEDVALLDDGNTGTAWTTVCYESRFMGAKQGVGIVTELTAGGPVNIDVDVDSAPWQLRVYTADELPTTLDGWGEPAASDFDDQARQMITSLPSAGRYVLVLLGELGRSDECSTDNPYQGRLSELSVTPG